MKLFGQKSQIPQLGEMDRQMQNAIDIVLNSNPTEAIETELDGERVLDEILREIGFSVESQHGANVDSPIAERGREAVEYVFALLDSPLATDGIKAAIGNFAFTAGLTYGATSDVVSAAFAAVLENDESHTYLRFGDVDSSFSSLLGSYLQSLTPGDASSLLASMKQACNEHAPELLAVLNYVEPSGTSGRSATSASPSATSGAATAKFCGSCGNPHKPGAKFCGSCGTPVAQVARG